jgi:polyhydroxybutyrate depolymerase
MACRAKYGFDECKNSPQTYNQLTPGDYSKSIVSGGKTRTFLIHVPKSYKEGTAVPLVLAFHGASSTAKQMETSTDFDSKADQENFIVVYPNGVAILKGVYYDGKWVAPEILRQVWNCGDCTEPKNNADDVGFTDDLITYMENSASIDEDRIFATGASNGGMFAETLACELSDRISGVASVLGVLSLDYNECNPNPKIPILHIHGLNDQTVLFNGGFSETEYDATISGCNKGRAIPDVMDFWRKENSCSADTEVVYENDKGVTCKTYVGCDDGKDVTLCTTEGDHSWPTTSNVHHFDATDYIWDDFFSKI